MWGLRSGRDAFKKENYFYSNEGVSFIDSLY
ncbi:hypothetical protein H710_00413 [Bartonella bacilliformis Ver097]|uniref:Uncharacterized protein n=1 Tax=Bartonella bacilliformis Ver097 TaxID=1293911 RepID=A0A072R307_BARBA|nr:hypothetical protein H710_00413 [Bartonella bacilliformis Ver097]